MKLPKKFIINQSVNLMELPSLDSIQFGSHSWYIINYVIKYYYFSLTQKQQDNPIWVLNRHDEQTKTP